MHGMIVYVCWLVLCFYRSVAFSRLLRVKMACVSSSDSRAIEYVKKENPQLSYDFQRRVVKGVFSKRESVLRLRFTSIFLKKDQVADKRRGIYFSA